VFPSIEYKYSIIDEPKFNPGVKEITTSPFSIVAIKLVGGSEILELRDGDGFDGFDGSDGTGFDGTGFDDTGFDVTKVELFIASPRAQFNGSGEYCAQFL
jgi:hypothetical protein